MTNTTCWASPQSDVHGLGFDPFKGAEEFRDAKRQRKGVAQAAAPAGGDWGPGRISFSPGGNGAHECRTEC